TAAKADLFLQIRAGADIAFLGGLIKYALGHDRVAKEYLVNYTNAAFVIKEGFKLPEDGLFSGFDSEKHTYNKSGWNYEAGGDLSGQAAAAWAALAATSKTDSDETTARPANQSQNSASGSGTSSKPGGFSQMGAVPTPVALLPPNVAYDLTLQHPRSVYQLMKEQYSRYTPEMVERITGIPQDQQLKAYDLFTSIRKDGDLKKVAAMIQLLMGNVGRAGGGVNALRGHSNIQGATDMGGVYDILPGYLKMPQAVDVNLEGYLKRSTPSGSKPTMWDSFNYWSNTPKFLVSFQKAMFGSAATKENDWAFDWLPKVDRRYAWADLWNSMYEGKVKGLFAFGMNGVMIGPNTQKNIDALKKADFLVVCEIYPDATSSFWMAPGISAEEKKQINTTVYQLAGAGVWGKGGTFVNSARWLQWKSAALPPPGDCRLDQDILAQIFLKIRELYQKEGGKFPDPILKASWAYTLPEHPSLSEVAKEINGKALADISDEKTGVSLKAGQQLPGFAMLRDDGTTSSANWLYCGSWTEAGPMMQRRGTGDPSGLGIYQNWGWSWPANRRVLYNRASCDLAGKPWDPTRSQVWWNETAQKWVGNDVPDFK